MPTARFPAFKPDFAPLGQDSETIQNVFRRKDGTYGHMKALSEIGNALDGACKGAGSFYGSDGTIVTFAGTATKLYVWDGTDTWTDVTRSSGAYTLATEHRWVYTQDGDRVYADNGIDARQYWDIGSSSAWADDPGTDPSFPPPIARYAAVADDDFMHFANTTTDRREIGWGEQFDGSAWNFGTNMADKQTFREGGQVTGLVGGEVMVWFQEQKIRAGFFEGPDLIYRIREISKQKGTSLPGSIAPFERTIIFRANDGFYRLDNGQTMTRIGDGVDDEFWENLDETNIAAIWSIIDPLRPFYMIAWPTSTGVADTLWVCNLELGSDGWAPSSYNIECLFPMYADVSVDLDTDSGETGDDDIDTPGLPSLDSDQYRGSPVQIVAAFTSNHKLAFFSGPSLEATLDTAEAQLGGGFQQVEVDRAIPLVSGGDPSISPQGKLGSRNRQQDSVTFSNAVTADDRGDFYFTEEAARFHRMRVINPAGMNFKHAVGVDFEPQPGGDL